MEWVENKRKEAEDKGQLNPFDATMVAQITPGELGGVFHALKFAEDLVVKWLPKHKFKNWNVTEARGITVTKEMKEDTAKEIAKKLTNHSQWRLHGRSIKIDDLKDIGLTIQKVDDDPKLADIVYRIQTVCRLLFDSSNIFKIFATQDNKIFRQAVLAGVPIGIPSAQLPDAVNIEPKCPKCGEIYKIYAKLIPDPQIDEKLETEGFIPFPKDAKITCKCGFELDLLGIKNEIEIKTGKKIIV